MKKAELVDRLAKVEYKLSQIYKYLPSLKYMEENEGILRSMGYSDFDIDLLFRSGSTYKKGGITDPETGEEMHPYILKTTIEKNPSCGKYEPYINGQPYMEFICHYKKSSEVVRQLSVEHPEIMELLQENERLKQMLTLVVK